MLMHLSLNLALVRDGLIAALRMQSAWIKAWSLEPNQDIVY